MRFLPFLVAVLGAFVAVAACGSGNLERLSPDSELDAGAVILPAADGGPSGAAGTGLVTGLPCDVQALLENRCIGCHDGTTAGTPRLLDWADLVAASKADPNVTIAQVALARMKSAPRPMPPPPAAPPEADEIATMQEWVSAGTPRAAACTDAPPPEAGLDASLDAEAGVDAAPPCTSGVKWTRGDQGSDLMHPGLACNACHQKSGGPNLRIAGTVYRGAHDIGDCNGAAPPPTLTVTITDKDGRVVKATVNAAGNFDVRSGGSARLRAPYRATVTDGTTVRAMLGSVTSGDCNSCHSAAGASGAPGRILSP
ncbi:MAG: hypothetical protein JWP97_3508 [Labilithrix sp.]|nr:hypothetical protein [Labilithrix sp.]